MNYTPHNYQAYCTQAVIDQQALALWLDCGLGKTIITLTALQDLIYNRMAVGKVLIIAPKKVAEATWQREAEKWDHLRLLKFSTVLGDVKKRVRALSTPADIYIMNRENVAWLVDRYRNDWPFDMVVLDEASSFKSPKAVRFKKLKAVRPHINRLVELTGTPAPKNALDTWAQIYLLDMGQRLGVSYTHCRDRYFEASRMTKNPATGALVGTGYGFAQGAEEAFYSQIRDVCISLRAQDWLELPDRIIDDIPVKLDSAAQKAYDSLERDMLLEVEGEVLDVGSAAALRNKLQQLGNGAAYDEDRNVVHVHDNKIEALLERIEALGDKHVLIFYAFQHDRDRILEALAKHHKDRVTKLFGGADDEIAWNTGQIDFLLAHPASCAYGLNIQDGGHNIVWFGLTDSLELYIQANARLHRQGQKMPVVIHRLVVEGSVDEDIVAGLEGKDACQEILLNRMRARIEKARENR